MAKQFFLLLVAILFTGVVLRGQQSGTLSAQQVMTALAGMRSDITLIMDENKRLSLRVEDLEEALRKKNTQYQDLQALCGSLAQQNQSLEARIIEIQKALESDQTTRQEDFKKLSEDLKKIVNTPSSGSGSAEPVVPKGMELRDYVVRKGDNLSTIAKGAGCSVSQIMAANPQLQSPDALRQGQTIHVPVKK